MKTVLTTAAAALMCFAGAPESADAGGFAISIGSPRGGFSYSNRPIYRTAGYGGFQNVGLRGGYHGGGYYGATPYGYRGYGGIGNSRVSNYGYRNYRSSGFGNYHGVGRSPYHYGGHRRGHYDYQPPIVVPHGNHYDVIPGHYDYHRGRHH